ncbi:MAG: hypothetical protein MUF00_05900 [Gemmatimonadaceae bacterium]|jgi:hypothetical protein|nr:hypothetical protein [Gemmatimonadaceae bacterium]
MSTLQENLKAANDAITYVQFHIKKAANKRQDRIEGVGGIEKTIEGMRKAAGLSVKPKAIPTVSAAASVSKKVSLFESLSAPPSAPKPFAKTEIGAGKLVWDGLSKQVEQVRLAAPWPSAPTFTDIEKVATAAQSAKVGNCHEQACLAVQYLLKLTKTKPDAVDLMEFTANGYDHVWVLVGRADGSKAGNPRDWGSKAVWCDPWQRDSAFSIADFVSGKIINLNAIYGCDSVDNVATGVPSSVFRYGTETR